MQIESAYNMYFINDRLTLPGAVVEDGRESANYDCNTGLYSFPSATCHIITMQYIACSHVCATAAVLALG